MSIKKIRDKVATTDTQDQKDCLEKTKTRARYKIPAFVFFLNSDAAEDVNGQILAVRRNETFLISHLQLISSIHRGDGLTPPPIADHLRPTFQNLFQSRDHSPEVFSWGLI